MPIKLGRISRQKDFEKIFRQGKMRRNGLFVLRLLATDLSGARLAVIISNKISKKAVVRNRLRRQIKEILRQRLVSPVGGYDLVFIGQPALLGCNFQEISEAIVDLLDKTGVSFSS